MGAMAGNIRLFRQLLVGLAENGITRAAMCKISGFNFGAENCRPQSTIASIEGEQHG